MLTLRFSSLSDNWAIENKTVLSGEGANVSRTHVTRDGSELSVSHFIARQDAIYPSASRFKLKDGSMEVTAKRVEIEGFDTQSSFLLVTSVYDLNDFVDAVGGVSAIDATSEHKMQKYLHLMYDDAGWDGNNGDLIVNETNGKEAWSPITDIGGWDITTIRNDVTFGFFTRYNMVCVEMKIPS